MRDFFPNSGILRLEELFKKNGQCIKWIDNKVWRCF
jgi:hypothetical protein